MVMDRDIVVADIVRDFDAQTMRVADMLSSTPISCLIEDSFADAWRLMRYPSIRRAPITDAHGVLIGIVTLDDLLQIVAESFQGLAKVVKSETK